VVKHPQLEPLVLHYLLTSLRNSADGSQIAKEADAGEVPATASDSEPLLRAKSVGTSFLADRVLRQIVCLVIHGASAFVYPVYLVSESLEC